MKTGDKKMKTIRNFSFRFVLFALLVATATILVGCGAVTGPLSSTDNSGVKAETTTTVAQPVEEVLVPVSIVVPTSKGLGSSRAITGMTVVARSFDTTTRIQQGTDRTLTETPAGSGTYTGYVSVGCLLYTSDAADE